MNELLYFNVSFPCSELLQAMDWCERDLFLQINMISAEGVEWSCWSAAVGHVETSNVGQLISSGGSLEKLLHDLFPPQALQALTLRIEDCCTQNNKSVEFIANDFISSSIYKHGFRESEPLFKVFRLNTTFFWNRLEFFKISSQWEVFLDYCCTLLALRAKLVLCLPVQSTERHLWLGFSSAQIKVQWLIDQKPTKVCLCIFMTAIWKSNSKSNLWLYICGLNNNSVWSLCLLCSLCDQCIPFFSLVLYPYCPSLFESITAFS